MATFRRRPGPRKSDPNPQRSKSLSERLGARHRAFLDGLPLNVREDNMLFVHASAAAPERWSYITGAAQAEQSMRAGGAGLTFCGHVHEQRLYFMGSSGRPMPMLWGRPTLVASWHMFEQSGKLLVPKRRTKI